jgi:Tfp pilus assembly protein PilN
MISWRKKMWPVILLKYWKELVLGVIVLGLCATVGIMRHQLNAKENTVELLTSKLALCQMQIAGLDGMLQKQNQAVKDLKTLADKQKSLLEVLLSQPPETIYRDRIREIPSLTTGDCEEVMDALADYAQELTDVQ